LLKPPSILHGHHVTLSESFFQVLGAFWYFLSIEREYACWRQACGKNCIIASWYCREDVIQFNQSIADSCLVVDTNKFFNFGIYLKALQNVTTSGNFLQKLFFCLWWGLQNLRFVWKTCFIAFIVNLLQFLVCSRHTFFSFFVLFECHKFDGN